MDARRRVAALGWRYGRMVRWVIVAVCLMAAVLSARGGGETTQVQTLTVAARDIQSGATLAPDDLVTTVATLPVSTPGITDLVGEVARGPLVTGEPITQGRIVPGGRVAPPDGTVVFPLTLPDERIAALLQSGDRVDVLVTPDALHEGQPRVLAEDIEVLGVLAATNDGLGGASPQSGSVVLLALPEQMAPQLAAIRRGDHVSVAIR